MTPEYLTVPELAELLRVKERKVYDLAASGEVPCSRATGKLLFPAAEVRAWIEGANAAEPLPRVVLGSHDPLLDWAIRQSRCGLATYFDGSHDGLARFSRREGVAAGLHVFDAGSETWNVSLVQAHASTQDAVLIRIFTRQRGIVCRPGSSIQSMKDLSDCRFVPRQPEAGTTDIFVHAAATAGLDAARLALCDIARTEDEAVHAVVRGDADATFGLGSVARVFGLSFVPVVEEPFDLLLSRSAYFSSPLQNLLGFLKSAEFSERAKELGGYDLTELGTVVWNAPEKRSLR